MDKSIIYRCYHPVMVNDEKGNKHFYSCGHCQACKVERGERISMRMKEVSQYYRYVLFFTFTYNDKDLPFFTLRSDIQGNKVLVPSTHNVPQIPLKDVSFRVDCANDFRWYNLPYRVRYNTPLPCSHQIAVRGEKLPKGEGTPVIPFADFTQISDTFKKFNDRFNKKHGYKERQFYYFVSNDYGFKLSRPHFHGLFFTNNPLAVEAFKTELRDKIWAHCDYDVRTKNGLFQGAEVVEVGNNRDNQLSFQKSIEKCVGYCSQYASFSTFYSRVYEFLQPFRSHYQQSTLPKEILKARIERLRTTAYTAIRNGYFAYSKYDSSTRMFVVVPLTTRDIASLFPPLSGYSGIPLNERVAQLQHISHLFAKYGEKKVYSTIIRETNYLYPGKYVNKYDTRKRYDYSKSLAIHSNSYLNSAYKKVNASTYVVNKGIFSSIRYINGDFSRINPISLLCASRCDRIRRFLHLGISEYYRLYAKVWSAFDYCRLVEQYEEFGGTALPKESDVSREAFISSRQFFANWFPNLMPNSLYDTIKIRKLKQLGIWRAIELVYLSPYYHDQCTFEDIPHITYDKIKEFFTKNYNHTLLENSVNRALEHGIRSKSHGAIK